VRRRAKSADPARKTASMTLIAERRPRREHAHEPRRKSAVWRFLKRHQLVELILIVGGICLAWLGAMLRSGQL
jgi:hypothetical protein